MHITLQRPICVQNKQSLKFSITHRTYLQRPSFYFLCNQFPALTLHSHSLSYISSAFFLHAFCIPPQKSLSLFISVIVKMSVLPLTPPPPSPCVCLSYLLVFLLPFNFPLIFALILSACAPASQCEILSVLFFYCCELMSGPSAVIQLSHSLLSPIRSTPLCPSTRHRLAALILRTTLLLLINLSGLLQQGRT